MGFFPASGSPLSVNSMRIVGTLFSGAESESVVRHDKHTAVGE